MLYIPCDVRVCKRFEPVKTINQNNNTKLVAFLSTFVVSFRTKWNAYRRIFSSVLNTRLTNTWALEHENNGKERWAQPWSHTYVNYSQRSWKICIGCVAHQTNRVSSHELTAINRCSINLLRFGSFVPSFVSCRVLKRCTRLKTHVYVSDTPFITTGFIGHLYIFE